MTKFLITVAFCSKFSTFRNLWKKQVFFSKNPNTSDEKTRFWTFLEILLFQSLFTGYYLPLSISKMLKVFFGKPICFFKQPNFCTFWEILLSQSFLRQPFYVEILAVLKIFKILFQKTRPFFFLKKQVLRLWKVLLFQSHSAAKMLLLTILWDARFFWKSHLNFFNKSHFLNVLKNFTHSVAFYGKANWQFLAVLDNLSFFSQETRPYFKKRQHWNALSNFAISVAF